MIYFFIDYLKEYFNKILEQKMSITAGINPNESALIKWNEFKMKKKLAAIVFKIEKVNGVEQVVLDKEFLKEDYK